MIIKYAGTGGANNVESCGGSSSELISTSAVYRRCSMRWHSSW